MRQQIIETLIESYFSSTSAGLTLINENVTNQKQK